MDIRFSQYEHFGLIWESEDSHPVIQKPFFWVFYSFYLDSSGSKNQTKKSHENDRYFWQAIILVITKFIILVDKGLPAQHHCIHVTINMYMYAQFVCSMLRSRKEDNYRNNGIIYINFTFKKKTKMSFLSPRYFNGSLPS